MKEKSNAIKKIYSLCFLGLMLLFGIATVVLFIINHLPSKNITSDNNGTISFLEQYPFAENIQEHSANSEKGTSFLKKKVITSIDDYQNIAYQITDHTEQYFTTLNPLSSSLKKVVNTISCLVSEDIIMIGPNAIFRLPNGYLAECLPYSPSYDVLNSILDFSTWMNEKNIPFISLITPDKSDDSVTKFPEGISQGYTRLMNEYKTFMKENSITYIDTKELLLTENDNFYSWFYQTDNHWNVHAAIVTARRIAEYLSNRQSIPVDMSALDEDKFKLKNYYCSFLGTYGRICLGTQSEDMKVLYPTEETSFHIQIPGYGIDKIGNFENTLIDQNCLGAICVSYRAFLYGDCPLISIKNNKCRNDTRILVIKYSFANVLCTYLANTVQYLDMIDPRYFNGSIRTYIEQTNPDVVLLCMGVACDYYEDSLNLK